MVLVCWFVLAVRMSWDEMAGGLGMGWAGRGGGRYCCIGVGVPASGRFLIRLSENRHLGNRYAPENFEHMAEKISPRYVEIRGLFGFRCT